MKLWGTPPIPIKTCPKCKGIFVPRFRFWYKSFWRGLLGLPACKLICSLCGEVAGYERAAE